MTNAPLAAIRYDNLAFNAFRGTDWIPELFQTCDRRDIDFGGCRCQAMAVLGDATATDPVCRKSPGRSQLDALIAEETLPEVEPDLVYRRL
ncbi:MAG: hypothetical protein AAFV87_18790 [Pseudomonadota bacterium]